MINMNRRKYYKRLKRWQRDNDKFYRDLYIHKLEDKLKNGNLTFAEKIELDNLKRARRRYRNGRWKK